MGVTLLHFFYLFPNLKNQNECWGFAQVLKILHSCHINGDKKKIEALQKHKKARALINY